MKAEELENLHHFPKGGKSPSDEEMRSFFDSLSKVDIPKGAKTKEEIWRSIEKRTEGEYEGKGKKAKWFYIGVPIAASIALAVVMAMVLTNRPNATTIATTEGQHRAVTLPDGSVVSLNAASLARYKKDSWDREVTLTGEAFFEVKEGSTFTVRTEDASVTVLGTSFNVYAREDGLEVKCKTGKVNIEVPSQSFSTELAKGQSLQTEDGRIVVKSVNTGNIGKWTSGEFFFDNKPLSMVIGELNRQFTGYSVSALVHEDVRFTGYFDNSDEIGVVLHSICAPLGLGFKVNEQTGAIVIK